MQTVTQEIRELQRRHALSAKWRVSGTEIVGTRGPIARCRSPEDAQLIVDMHRWFGTLVNVVVMMKRAEADKQAVAVAEARDAGDGEIERRLRLLDEQTQEYIHGQKRQRRGPKA